MGTTQIFMKIEQILLLAILTILRAFLCLISQKKILKPSLDAWIKKMGTSQIFMKF